jgi:glucosamine--fructose-6-phosphate aminotransferase (isomerizing)
MSNRQQLQEIPGALRMTLEKARAEYGAVVRKVRWGDGPIYVCGEGDCSHLGMAASCAFEAFPGWPVVAKSVELLQMYTLHPLRRLRPRTVLMLISSAGEWPEGLELVHAAHKGDCIVVVLTNTPDSPLAKIADHVFFTRAEVDAASPAMSVCTYAALNFLAFEAARLLKRPEPQWKSMPEEFEQLPEKIDWVFTQLPQVVRSMAAEMVRPPRLRIVGGGFNHYPAWQGAWRLRSLASPQVGAVEASEFLNEHAYFARRGESVLLLSGSHSKIKKLVQRGAAQARTNGARVLCLTDGNDQELVAASDLGILVPSLSEMPASILTLFMLEWLAMEALHAAKP